ICVNTCLQGIDDDSELPTPIRNIIGTSHTMEIKSYTYYEHPTYESFNCWKLNPTELANEGTTYNDQLILSNAPESSFKRLTKDLTMSTPSKPNETMSKKRLMKTFNAKRPKETKPDPTG
ncbi:hypothetical protein Tco_1572397, partial [Tanacetum coccineum]